MCVCVSNTSLCYQKSSLHKGRQTAYLYIFIFYVVVMFCKRFFLDDLVRIEFLTLKLHNYSVANRISFIQKTLTIRKKKYRSA